MGFFRTDRPMQDVGGRLVEALLEGGPRGESGPHDLSVTLVIDDEAPGRRPRGFSFNGRQLFYPCSVVKVFWLAACEARLEEGYIQLHAELERAMHDMIVWSSNTGTNYVIDLVTDTTGDTLLEGAEFDEWARRRNWANRYYQSLGWEGLDGINVCQKLMDDDRYGRERQFVGPEGANHNRLTTLATARLFHEIFAGATFPPERAERMRQLLHRRHDPAWVEAHPNAQVRGYFGEALPRDAELWSKAGWTGWTGDRHASYRRHDAARIEIAGLPPFILVVFTQGKLISADERFLPGAASATVELNSARAVLMPRSRAPVTRGAREHRSHREPASGRAGFPA